MLKFNLLENCNLKHIIERARPCQKIQIQMRDHIEYSYMFFDRWTQDDYIQQWKLASDALRSQKSQSAFFVLSVHAVDVANFAEVLGVWRVGEEFRAQMDVVDILKECDIRSSQFYNLPPYSQYTEEGYEVSDDWHASCVPFNWSFN